MPKAVLPIKHFLCRLCGANKISYCFIDLALVFFSLSLPVYFTLKLLYNIQAILASLEHYLKFYT